MLSQTEQKHIQGGTDKYGNPTPEEIHASAVAFYKSAGAGAPCPTWEPCFSDGPIGCVDMCMHEPGGH